MRSVGGVGGVASEAGEEKVTFHLQGASTRRANQFQDSSEALAGLLCAWLESADDIRREREVEALSALEVASPPFSQRRWCRWWALQG